MIHGGSWIARSVAPLALVLALVLAAVVGACTDTSTGPTQIVSLEFDTLAFPSVMTGDTLRDSLGKVAPLHAVAFNGNGAVVANPAIKYLTLDSTVAISPTGIVTAQARAGGARIIASAAGLQSVQRILLISRRPDTLVITSKKVDTLNYALIDNPSTNASSPFSVRVITRDTAGGVTGSTGWLVSYQAFYRGKALVQSDTTVATLWNKSSAVPSLVDTTTSDGSAGRRLRLRPVGLQAVRDSFVVLATVRYRGAQVAGSPARFVLVVVPKLP
jgi:hypothetical protein